MRSSAIVGRGTRPLATSGSPYYRQHPKDTMAAATRVDVEAMPLVVPSSYLDSSQYEFPGDRTYQRYLASRLEV